MDIFTQVMRQAAIDNALAREHRLTDAERNAKHRALVEVQDARNRAERKPQRRGKR